LKNSFKHIPQYFGANLNADKLVAYAPSIGFCPLEEFEKSEEAKDLKRFSVIMARDEQTKVVCERILKKEIQEVCDPTILYLDCWKEFLSKKAGKQKKDFIAYYAYGTKDNIKEYTLRFAKEKGLQVLALGFNHTWCDNVIVCGPMMFLDMLSKASFVVTTTFHGSIFSTILQKKVIVKPSGQKVFDYLKKVDMQDKIFYDGMSYEEFKAILESDYNYNHIRNLQCKLKEESLKKLKESLK